MKAQAVSVGEGFVEGLAAPFIELLISVFIVLGMSIQNAFSTIGMQSVSTISFVEIFVVFVAIDLLRNFLVGLFLPKSGISYIAGAVIGVVIMSVIASDMWVTIGGIICVSLGLLLRVYLFIKMSPE